MLQIIKEMTWLLLVAPPWWVETTRNMWEIPQVLLDTRSSGAFYHLILDMADIWYMFHLHVAGLGSNILGVLTEHPGFLGVPDASSPTCLSIYQSNNQITYQPLYRYQPMFYVSTYALSVYLPIYLSIYLAIYLSIYLSIFFSFFLSV